MVTWLRPSEKYKISWHVSFSPLELSPPVLTPGLYDFTTGNGWVYHTSGNWHWILSFSVSLPLHPPHPRLFFSPSLPPENPSSLQTPSCPFGLPPIFRSPARMVFFFLMDSPKTSSTKFSHQAPEMLCQTPSLTTNTISTISILHGGVWQIWRESLAPLVWCSYRCRSPEISMCYRVLGP